jgi:hypothetical protein
VGDSLKHCRFFHMSQFDEIGIGMGDTEEGEK